MIKNTIVGVATPIGTGGICIIRLSGDDSLSIADQMFIMKNNQKISTLQARVLYYGIVKTEKFNDVGQCVYYKAPNSYTGEDVIEFQCHGGVKVAEGILQECIKCGARMAEAGEFTKRAFLNGKTTLASAEGVIDMINAESDAELKAASSLTGGELSDRVKVVQNILTDTTAQIEVELDYPEYDITEASKDELVNELTTAKQSIQELVNTSATGQIIKNGINVVIVGSPNVGKSSLLNALLNSERAIVTEIPGTTRDTLEESYVYSGVKVNIIDTAGIRQSQDTVEKIGIERAKLALKQSDLALLVLDCSRELSEDDYNNIKLVEGHRVITVINKTDIKNEKTLKTLNELKLSSETFVSALNKKGIEELKKAIYNMVIDQNIMEKSLIITNIRHINALNDANTALTQAISALKSNSLDCVADDVRTAWEKLGEITGQVYTEEILNAIFSKFCLGK